MYFKKYTFGNKMSIENYNFSKTMVIQMQVEALPHKG